MAGPCHLCGAAHAPYGFRRPGLRADMPAGEPRRYLRACGDCREAAEARWRRRFGLEDMARAPSAPPGPTPAAPGPVDPEIGGLFAQAR